MYMGILMEIQDIWRQIDNYGTWQGEPFSQELAHEKFIEFDAQINSHRDHLSQEDLNELDRMAEEQDRYEVEEHDEMARALGWDNYHHMVAEEDQNTVEAEAPATPPSASDIAPPPSPPAITRDTSIIQHLEPIPRDEMELFNPKNEKLRFSFILYNNEGVGTAGCLQWAESVGVFDFWQNTGSFSPSWDSQLPCQTYFGIE